MKQRQVSRKKPASLTIPSLALLDISSAAQAGCQSEAENSVLILISLWKAKKSFKVTSCPWQQRTQGQERCNEKCSRSAKKKNPVGPKKSTSEEWPQLIRSTFPTNPYQYKSVLFGLQVCPASDVNIKVMYSLAVPWNMHPELSWCKTRNFWRGKFTLSLGLDLAWWRQCAKSCFCRHRPMSCGFWYAQHWYSMGAD